MSFLERVACNICQSHHHVPVWAIMPREASQDKIKPRRSQWVVCRNCGLVFQNPRPTAQFAQSLYAQGGYRNWTQVPEDWFQYTQFRPQPIMEWLGRQQRVKSLLSAPNQSKKVLDIGSGIGGAAHLFAQRGWEAYGVEPDPLLARAGQERFGVPIVADFMRADLFPGVDFDLAISLHTFEHLFDPLDVARSAHTLLRKRRGFLCIAVPTYVRATHWAWEWMNLSHTYIFSGPTLANLLANAGFETVAWKYPPRYYHPASEPSEVWILAQAKDEDVPQQVKLPYRESVRQVQAELVSVPGRAAIWGSAHVVRRVGGRIKHRLLVRS